ncbi:hypothetical protein D3C84_958900 [compost metagenome]
MEKMTFISTRHLIFLQYDKKIYRPKQFIIRRIPTNFSSEPLIAFHQGRQFAEHVFLITRELNLSEASNPMSFEGFYSKAICQHLFLLQHRINLI